MSTTSSPSKPFKPTSLILLLYLPLILSSPTCRSYCGNITIDYPFGVRNGCGHPIFRELLFCIDNLLLLHLPSGSYRVLSIDYSFRRLTLNDPTMSDCYSLSPTPSPPHGFSPNSWRAQFLRPVPDNVFFLLGCQHDSPVFEFCGNVSGMGCDDYYRCPAWESGRRLLGCCAVAGGVVREVNLTRLGCVAYSSAYRIAPVRARGAGEWDYGVGVAYSVPGDDEAGCRDCRVSGGSCGYDGTKVAEDGEDDDRVAVPRLCICGVGIDAWNSTSNCDDRGMYDWGCKCC